MYQSVQAFMEDWKFEAAKTKSVLESLTDASLSYQSVTNQRSIGRVAWHTVTSVYEFMAPTGADLGVSLNLNQVPDTAAAIPETYTRLCDAGMSIVSQWDDSFLQETRNYWGEEWTIGFAMLSMIKHEIHHRGQLTALMRQAGIKPPVVYGPAQEDWASFGMEAPVV
jgi:Uncharacterized protein conserved in bacteria